ncbi:MAG: hypothetical protein Q4A65_02560 [Bacillota bacterium]|nr:hypothetical protein [Bacillota bacterium]
MNDFNNQSFNHQNFNEQNNNRNTEEYLRPIYERIWFIVVAFLLFWPAGIILAIWRFTRDQQIGAANQAQNIPLSDQWQADQEAAQDEAKLKARRAKVNSKRSCKAWKIWGWVLVALGAFWLFSGPVGSSTMENIIDYASGVGFVIAGAILLIAAKRTVRKWDRYESYINNRGNTSLENVAEKMGLPLKTVRTDIQAMINKGFFSKPKYGISAYINGEYDLLVMLKYGEPMQPVEKPKPKAERPKAGSYQAILEEEIARTTDPELGETLNAIKASITRIDEKLKEEPALEEMTNIKKLKSSYIPQTLELVKKYNDGEGSEETRWEIKAMIGTCAKAFKNIETKVYEREDIDTKVDMEVLRKTFEREGLLGSDFDIKK